MTIRYLTKQTKAYLDPLKMKSFLRLLVLFVLFGLNSSLKAAENIQTTTLHDGKELILNGLGRAKQLSDSFYIAALYLEEPYRSVDNITYINSYKRMQIRIASKRVSSRRFAQYWKESISINNPRNIWEPQVKDVLAFTALFKQTLKKGDIVNLDYVPAMGTYVNINGVFMGRIRNPGFHNLLMMTWLGNRPPNELFKLGVMGGNDGNTAVKLQQEFELLQPTAERIAISKSWFDEDAGNEDAVEKKVVAKKPAPKKVVVKKPAPKKIVVKKPVPKKVVAKKTTPKPEKKIVVKVEKPPVEANKVTQKLAETIAEKAPIKIVTNIVDTNDAEPEKLESEEEQPKILTSSEQLKLYAARNSYERELRQTIRKFQKYPLNKMLRNRSYRKQMERGPIESSGVLWVKIGRNGSVISSKLEQSTGISILDKAAIDMVEKADPLPEMPELLAGDDFEFLIQLKFLSPEL